MIGNRRVNQDILARKIKRRSHTRTALFTAANLAPRFKRLAVLVRDEKVDKEIAFEMGLTVGSVHQYMHRLIRKLRVKSRVGVALWADRNLAR